MPNHSASWALNTAGCILVTMETQKSLIHTLYCYVCLSKWCLTQTDDLVQKHFHTFWPFCLNNKKRQNFNVKYFHPCTFVSKLIDAESGVINWQGMWVQLVLLSGINMSVWLIQRYEYITVVMFQRKWSTLNEQLKRWFTKRERKSIAQISHLQ